MLEILIIKKRFTNSVVLYFSFYFVQIVSCYKCISNTNTSEYESYDMKPTAEISALFLPMLCNVVHSVRALWPYAISTKTIWSHIEHIQVLGFFIDYDQHWLRHKSRTNLMWPTSWYLFQQTDRKVRCNASRTKFNNDSDIDNKSNNSNTV